MAKRDQNMLLNLLEIGTLVSTMKDSRDKIQKYQIVCNKQRYRTFKQAT
jgi:hypothetical protein